MFVLAHNDPIWITFGISIGIALALIAVRASAHLRK